MVWEVGRLGCLVGWKMVRSDRVFRWVVGFLGVSEVRFMGSVFLYEGIWKRCWGTVKDIRGWSGGCFDCIVRTH